jgi:hypothetical protein
VRERHIEKNRRTASAAFGGGGHGNVICEDSLSLSRARARSLLLSAVITWELQEERHVEEERVAAATESR